MCVCACVFIQQGGNQAAQIPPHLVAAVGSEHLKTRQRSPSEKSQEDHPATNCFTINCVLIFISARILCVLYCLFACIFFQVWSLQFFCGSVDNTGRAWLARAPGNITYLWGTPRREVVR